jgi:hypothetical protein
LELAAQTSPKQTEQNHINRTEFAAMSSKELMSEEASWLEARRGAAAKVSKRRGSLHRNPSSNRIPALTRNAVPLAGAGSPGAQSGGEILVGKRIAAPAALQPLIRGRERQRDDSHIRAFSVSPTHRAADRGSPASRRKVSVVAGPSYEAGAQQYRQVMSIVKQQNGESSSRWKEAGPPTIASHPTSPTFGRSARRAPSISGISGSPRLPGLPGLPEINRRRRSTIGGGATAAFVEDATLVPSIAVDADDDDDGAPAGRGRSNHRIKVVVRKRPLLGKELGERDCIAVRPPGVAVEATKQRIDLSEYREAHQYNFDNAYGEAVASATVFEDCAKDLIDCVFEGGSASCFAYGQTGSGKTHTMLGSDTQHGIYVLAANDIFQRRGEQHHVFVSLYEIYCNSLFDLLNGRATVVAREDAAHRVNICGLTWHAVESVAEIVDMINHGTQQRRTGSTSANEFSSRSHAVLTMTLRDETQPKFLGSLNVCDLAGSERAADVTAMDKQTRLEGAEINKSLLALKECIRGLDERRKHIPFRGSKLTEVLRDSFMGNSRTVMIATISPAESDVEHSLNTLRYAFRVKGLSADHVLPSILRNAPRAVLPPKAKSVEPPARKKHRHRTHGADVVAGDGAVALHEVEKKIAADIGDLRKEMTAFAAAKRSDEHTIHALQAANDKLARQMANMERRYDERYDTDGGGGAPESREDGHRRRHRGRRSTSEQRQRSGGGSVNPQDL